MVHELKSFYRKNCFLSRGLFVFGTILLLCGGVGLVAKSDWFFVLVVMGLFLLLMADIMGSSGLFLKRIAPDMKKLLAPHLGGVITNPEEFFRNTKPVFSDALVVSQESVAVGILTGTFSGGGTTSSSLFSTSGSMRMSGSISGEIRPNFKDHESHMFLKVGREVMELVFPRTGERVTPLVRIKKAGEGDVEYLFKDQRKVAREYFDQVEVKQSHRRVINQIEDAMKDGEKVFVTVWGYEYLPGVWNVCAIEFIRHFTKEDIVFFGVADTGPVFDEILRQVEDAREKVWGPQPQEEA